MLLYMMQVMKPVCQQKLPVIITSAETGRHRLDWRGVTNLRKDKMHNTLANENKAQLRLGFCLLILVCIVTFLSPILNSLQALPNGSRVLMRSRSARGFEYQDGDLVFELARVISVQKLQ